MKPVKVAHVITSLEVGGAQMMLAKLLEQMDRAAFTSFVVSLTSDCAVGGRLEALDVPYESLGMSRWSLGVSPVLRMTRILRRERPDIVQTWMYHADLVGGIAARLTTKAPVIWNIRQSAVDSTKLRRRTMAVARLCARWSRWLPTHVVSCSNVAADAHRTIGYAAERMSVIPNGFDLDLFHVDSNSRDEIRRQLSVDGGASVVGMVARYHRQKDISTFLAAASWLSERLKTAFFVLCGDGMDWQNTELAAMIRGAGLTERFQMLGRRSDVHRIYPAFDVATLSSAFGEGFPNVVGEAMACGVPCVVTDVGDSALIVGETGRVVPPRDPIALGQAWLNLLSMDAQRRGHLSRMARKRMEERYDIKIIAKRYAETYFGIATNACV